MANLKEINAEELLTFICKSCSLLGCIDHKSANNRIFFLGLIDCEVTLVVTSFKGIGREKVVATAGTSVETCVEFWVDSTSSSVDASCGSDTGLVAGSKMVF